MNDAGLMYTGGENSAPFNELIKPAPRGHVPQMSNKKSGAKGGGYMLMKPLVDAAVGLGVQAEYNVRVQSLVVDQSARVVGIVAKRYGKTLAVRARRGVVLAMGGFAYNESMLRDHSPSLVGRPGAAIEAHDGTAIRMGQSLGAATSHMDAAVVAINTDPQMLYRGIIVNGRGQRFIAEDTYVGRVAQEVLFHQNDDAFLIIDERAYEEALRTRSTTALLRENPTWVSDSFNELEAEMGLPAGALTSTVDLYNGYARDGADPLFGKKQEWVKPIEAPAAVFDLRKETIGFPLGGLKTNVNAEVLHISGEPISGLYAAGRCTSGVCAGGYASGASLGDSSFFGRRAGLGAARAIGADQDLGPTR